ncbi:MAG: hypothetical protein RI894_1221 [Bacteroidota bacterium]|jgi:hypothetical protein
MTIIQVLKEVQAAKIESYALIDMTETDNKQLALMKKMLTIKNRQ